MTLTQVLGAVLIALSLVGFFALGGWAFAKAVLSEVETERVDLVNDARPCSRGLRAVK